MPRAIFVSFLLVIATCLGLSAQDFTVLYNFCPQFGCIDGSGPLAPVVQDPEGNFYGTTSFGGVNHWGTVFEMTPEGALTTLYSFCADPEQSCPDGQEPWSGLVLANDGNFYGTTLEGGPSGAGTLFRITRDGVLTTIHTFNGFDGHEPSGDLIQASDGYLYGVTAALYGNIYKVSLQGDVTVLYRFCTTNCKDGAGPYGPLVQATDGNIYGVTGAGGLYHQGTIFKITTQGTLTTLYNFCPQQGCLDGSFPVAGLVQGIDRNFYGVTNTGGAYNYGSVFKVTPQGMLTSLHSFDRAEAVTFYAGLVQGSDGNLYGASYQGGDNCFPMGGCGTIFRITPTGTLTTLHNFDGTDGQFPAAPLVQTRDGNFYGTTVGGGANNSGTVYRLAVFADLSVIKSGMGTVSSVDGKIYCGTLCSYRYDIGAELTLSAVPASGYTFTGWTGCDNVNGSYCSVTMTSAKNVTATFTTANITLTSLTFKPSYVKGGQLSAGTVSLSGPAPQGGVR